MTEINFHKNISKLVKKSGKTTCKLSKEIGISHASLFYYKERGSHRANFTSLAKICDFFKVNLHDLMFGDIEDCHDGD